MYARFVYLQIKKNFSLKAIKAFFYFLAFQFVNVVYTLFYVRVLLFCLRL